MTDSPLVLGIDLGTSGIRTAVVAANGAVLDSRSQAYGGDFANPHSWREGCGSDQGNPASAAIPAASTRRGWHLRHAAGL